MRRAWKSAGVAVALAALGLGYLADDVRRNMRYDAQLSWVDGSCTLLATPTPCEDMSALGDGHSAFAGGGDIWKAFEHGSEGVADGAVWLVNATAGVVRKLEVDAPAGLPKLVLHGVYYSQSSRRLYAVNHDEASGESVEVFEVEGEGDALRLRHAHSVRSPLFGNFALNDVVEGGAADEFYVTEWQPFPMPARGKAAAKDAPWRVRLGRALIVPIAMLKIRTTRVLRCTLRGAPASPACEVASASRWVMANGIAISADRRSVFVNDPVTRTVTVLERDGLTGALTAVSQFGTKHTRAHCGSRTPSSQNLLGPPGDSKRNPKHTLPATHDKSPDNSNR
eukprot:1467482-Prymnesium_polylepis.1